MTDKFKKIREIQSRMDSVQSEMDQVRADVKEILSDLTQLNYGNGFPTKAEEVLKDLEAIHFNAVVTGNLEYMQKIGTLLEKYKGVRGNSKVKEDKDESLFVSKM